MNRSIRALLLAPSFVLAASACADHDRQPWWIDRPRVLALRVEDANDPTSALPAPGDEVRVRGLVVDPARDRTGERAWRFEACPASPESRDGLGCDGEPFASPRGRGPIDLTFGLPDVAGRVLLRGVVCTGGEPEAEALRCADGGPDGDGEEVMLRISTSTDQANRHPRLDGSPTLDGDPIPEGQGCADPATRRWPAAPASGPTTPALLAWSLGPEARERVDGEPEELLVSHAVTAGELERYYSIVQADEQEAKIEVELEPPRVDEVPVEGLDLRLVLVVRDDRGGVSWLTRVLCVTGGGGS